MDTRTLKSMSDEECKNLVYLMLRRYKDRWEKDFPQDMNISLEDCRTLYNSYSDIVTSEIEREKQKEHKEQDPSVDEIIRRGMRRLMDTIESSDDPSKVARAIELLSGLPDQGEFKREKKKSMFEIMQEKVKNV